MINVIQLKRFISGDFTKAIFSGKVKRNRIDLRLYLDSLDDYEDSQYQMVSTYSVDLQELKKEPKILCNYLIDTFLQYNTIIGLEYNTVISHHPCKVGFVIKGIDRTFNIALPRQILDILPEDFISRLELAKKEGIIKFLESTEIKQFSVDNYMNEKDFVSFKTGITYYDNIDCVFYRELKVRNSNGEIISYPGEVEFIKKLLKLITEKGRVDLKSLEKIKKSFGYDYFYSFLRSGYLLNNRTTFDTNTKEGLEILKQFLSEYLDSYKDEIKENQLVLRLK